jgi:hypothetical protein
MLGHRSSGTIWAALALTALLAAAVLAPAATAKKGHKGAPTLEFRGQAIIPTGTTFMGTTVGGLSSISYAGGKSFYVISDDQANARFYKLRARIADGELDNDDITFTSVTTLKQPDGTPYPTAASIPRASPSRSTSGRPSSPPRASRTGSSTPGSASTDWTAPMSATSRSRRSSTRTRPARKGFA